MWSYWSKVDSFPLPASTVNFQVPLSTGSVEFSSIWQVLSSGLLKVILPLSALEVESYGLDKRLHMRSYIILVLIFYGLLMAVSIVKKNNNVVLLYITVATLLGSNFVVFTVNNGTFPIDGGNVIKYSVVDKSIVFILTVTPVSTLDIDDITRSF